MLELHVFMVKNQILIETDHGVPTDSSVSSQFGTDLFFVYKTPKEPTKVLSIEDESERHELTRSWPLMSTNHQTSHETVKLHANKLI
jgi:hypothetical protein